MKIFDVFKGLKRVNNREGSAVVSVLGALTLVAVFVTGAMTYSTNLNNNISFISNIVEETSKGKFEIQTYLENMNNIADLPSYREEKGLTQVPSSTAYYSDTCTGTSYTVSYGTIVSRDVCLYFGGTSTTSNATLWSFGMASNTDISINGTASVSSKNIYASDYVYNNSSFVYSYLNKSVYNLVEESSLRYSLWDATTIYSDGLYSCNNSCYNYTSQVLDESEVQYSINYGGYTLDGDGFDNTLLADTVLSDWMDGLDLQTAMLEVLKEKSPIGNHVLPAEFDHLNYLYEFFDYVEEHYPAWTQSITGCDGDCYNVDSWSGAQNITESTIVWMQAAYMNQYYVNHDNPEEFYMFFNSDYEFAPIQFDGQAFFSDSITISKSVAVNSDYTSFFDRGDYEMSGVIYVNGDVTIDLEDNVLYTVDQYGNDKPLVIIATGDIIFKSYDNDRDGDNIVDGYFISGGSIIFEDIMTNINISGGLYSLGSGGSTTYTAETDVSDLDTFNINSRYNAGTYLRYGSNVYYVLQDTIYNEITNAAYFERIYIDLNYNSNTTYGLYDIVCTYEDDLCNTYYMSIQSNNLNRGLDNGSYWKKINNMHDEDGYLTYDSTYTYDEYSLIKDNNIYYTSLKDDNMGNELSSTNNWNEIGSNIEAWSIGTYRNGDVVLFNGSYYVATRQIRLLPPSLSSYWLLLDDLTSETNDDGFETFVSGKTYTNNSVVCSSTDASVCYTATTTASSTSLTSSMWNKINTSDSPDTVMAGYSGIFITSFVGRITATGQGKYQYFEEQNTDSGIFITQSNSLTTIYNTISTSGGDYNTFYDNIFSLPSIELADNTGTSYSYLSDWY